MPEPLIVQPRAHEPHHLMWVWIVLTLSIALLSGVSTYAYLRMTELEMRLATLHSTLASTSAELVMSREILSRDIAFLAQETRGISENLSTTKKDVALAQNTLSAVENKVGGVEESIGSITGTVTTLQKLSATDPELLKKYSKVYFLNENYAPEHLTTIPQSYLYSNIRSEAFLTRAYPYLLEMLDAAKSEGVIFYVHSAYRSFATQQALKSDHVMTYGAGTANTFSADQGYSEHQIGTTVDFITSGMGGKLDESFAETPAFRWLNANAHKYGFILSYPEGNSYYIYEPWHWRFVGVKLATEINTKGIRFYDMDQRDIDGYLAEIFD